MFTVGEDTFAKLFSLHEGILQEIQLEDLSEELYSVSFCDQKGKFGLSVGGENGIVQHISLDANMNFKMDSIQNIFNLGSAVKALQWTSDGHYLVIAGATNKVVIYNTQSKSTVECKGVDISSEGLFASVSSDNKNFAVSFKDGSIVLGEFETGSLVTKIQAGDAVKGSDYLNQSGFDFLGNLFVPGKNVIQKCSKSDGYKIHQIDELLSRNVTSGVLVPDPASIYAAAFSGSEVSVFSLKDLRQVKTHQVADPVRQIVYSPQEDTLIAVTIEGEIFTLVDPFELKIAAGAPSAKPKLQEERAASKTESVQENLEQAEIDKIVEQE